MKKNVIVIYGSKSTEHDISILSALQIYSALNKEKYNVELIYIAHSGKWFCGAKLRDIKSYSNFNEKGLKQVSILPSSNFLYIKKIGGYKPYKKVDCAILSLHGKNGEDGTVQGLLELANIPYSSSSVLGCATSLDKITMKMLFKENNINITDYSYLTKKDFLSNSFKIDMIKRQIDFPVVIKPNSLGSSIGITIANDDEKLLEGLNLAFMFDEKVIIEKKVENLKEVNISVLGNGKNNILSSTEEVQNKSGLLSFEKKYLSTKASKCDVNCKNLQKNEENEQKNSKKSAKNKSLTKQQSKFNLKMCCNDESKLSQSSKNGMQNLDRVIPANITKKQLSQIETMAKKIFEITSSKGVVRIDFMIDEKSKKVYANEINSIPGSFAFYLWQNKGISFDRLADKLVEIAIEDFESKQKLLSIFNSSVLNIGQSNSIK